MNIQLISAFVWRHDKCRKDTNGNPPSLKNCCCFDDVMHDAISSKMTQSKRKTKSFGKTTLNGWNPAIDWFNGNQRKSFNFYDLHFPKFNRFYLTFLAIEIMLRFLYLLLLSRFLSLENTFPFLPPQVHNFLK